MTLGAQNLRTAGARIRWLRKSVLKLTQDKLAEALGTDRTFINKVEADSKKPSHELLNMLREKYNVSSDWVVSGRGDVTLEGGVRGHEVTYDSWQDVTKGVVREGPGEYLTGGDAARSRDLVRRFVPGADGRFGYMLLNGNTKLRLHAARDKGVQHAPNLIQIVEDDNLWKALGDVQGWELEVLREYLEDWGDRELEYWFEGLRLLRWSAQRVAAKAARAIPSKEEQA